MIRIFALVLIIATSSPALCAEVYSFNRRCWVDTPNSEVEDLCRVIETRNKKGFLMSRSIYSNRFSLTLKSWFTSSQGILT